MMGTQIRDYSKFLMHANLNWPIAIRLIWIRVFDKYFQRFASEPISFLLSSFESVSKLLKYVAPKYCAEPILLQPAFKIVIEKALSIYTRWSDSVDTSSASVPIGLAAKDGTSARLADHSPSITHTSRSCSGSRVFGQTFTKLSFGVPPYQIY